jgi:hypothetical protein
MLDRRVISGYARNPAGIVVTPETDTRKSLKRGFRRDHA